MAGPLVAMQGD
uniref:Uncharacterized protein n=1 Tax=Anguilla anguilla TaxID=7936 RepID=A0A0E9TFW3_ANGAN